LDARYAGKHSDCRFYIVKGMHLKYRPDIDGLRAVAVLAVFFHHLNSNLVPGGYIGVDIFL